MNEKLAYTVNEAIEVSSLGRDTLYAAMNSGALRAKKKGVKTIILADDLRDFLKTLPDYEPSAANAAE